MRQTKVIQKLRRENIKLCAWLCCYEKRAVYCVCAAWINKRRRLNNCTQITRISPVGLFFNSKNLLSIARNHGAFWMLLQDGSEHCSSYMAALQVAQCTQRKLLVTITPWPFLHPGSALGFCCHGITRRSQPEAGLNLGLPALQSEALARGIGHQPPTAWNLYLYLTGFEPTTATAPLATQVLHSCHDFLLYASSYYNPRKDMDRAEENHLLLFGPHCFIHPAKPPKAVSQRLLIIWIS